MSGRYNFGAAIPPRDVNVTAGFEAGKAGLPSEKNPFNCACGQRNRHDAWLRGWCEGFAIYRAEKLRASPIPQSAVRNPH
jgi:ribosome modulation factor